VFSAVGASAQTTATPPTAETVLAADNEVLQQVVAAHGGDRLSKTDFVAEAKVTLQTAAGPVVVPVTILRSSNGGQRIQFNQSDGKPWDGRIEHLEANSRRILEFVQTQYERALPSILGNTKRQVTVVDNGVKDGTQLLNASETTVTMKDDASFPRVSQAKSTVTRYTIDATTSRLAKMEFDNGQTTDANGKKTPRTETYTYSDVRNSGGIPAAFHIEHYINGVKQEDLVLTNVRAIPVKPSLTSRGRPVQ
jgi:hypothetical protein